MPRDVGVDVKHKKRMAAAAAGIVIVAFAVWRLAVGQIVDAVVILVAGLIGYVAAILLGPGRIPGLTRERHVFSIGIAEGPSPLALSAAGAPANPVLTREDITDVPAGFVADPFLIRRDDAWYMFMEVFNRESARGEIGFATSADGSRWTYKGIVLRDSVHMSYPQVIEVGGEVYMVPETHEAHAVRLYQAVEFPWTWTYIGNLLRGPIRDATLFENQGSWWMFFSDTPGHDSLRLFAAPDLKGPWSEHPASPLMVRNRWGARPAGGVIRHGEKLYRPGQVGFPDYGSGVRFFEIETLTADRYVESSVESAAPLSGSGRGWNGLGMHHVHCVPNGEGWIAAVDGWSDRISFLGRPLPDSALSRWLRHAV